MEGVGRKVFRELTEHYKKLDQATQEKIAKVTQGGDLMKKRVDQQESAVKKLQSAVSEINAVNKKMQMLVSFIPSGNSF